MTTHAILVPSLGRGAADFDHLAAALRDAGFAPLAVEPPTEIPGVAEPTLHDLAAHVVALMDAHAIDRAHLVGHAFGQRVARALVARHPERVDLLVMIAAGGYVAPAPDISESIRACFDASLGPDEHLAHVARAFFAPGNDASVWSGGWLPTVAALQQQALARTDPDSWRHATARQVLVIQGLQDAAAVPENGHRYAVDHPGVVRVVDLDGAGHALLPEQPAAIARHVVEFLGAA